jgi:hypothetical protein
LRKAPIASDGSAAATDALLSVAVALLSVAVALLSVAVAQLFVAVAQLFVAVAQLFVALGSDRNANATHADLLPPRKRLGGGAMQQICGVGLRPCSASKLVSRDGGRK